jgi:predicted RNA-binding Zn ribbon-like protein
MSFPMLGEPLPIELVNTLYAGRNKLVDGLAAPDDLVAWLQAHASQFQTDVAGATGERVNEFRELREALRVLFRATLKHEGPPAAAVDTLNRMSAAAPAFPQLRWSSAGEPHVTVKYCGDDPAASVLTEVAQSSLQLLGGPDRLRLRACHAPGCVLFFLKDHPRREWCSGACGNRARAARHYQRHRQTES